MLLLLASETVAALSPAPKSGRERLVQAGERGWLQQAGERGWLSAADKTEKKKKQQQSKIMKGRKVDIVKRRMKK